MGSAGQQNSAGTRRTGLRIALLTYLACGNMAIGQIVPDGSLGPTDPRVGPDYIIPASIGQAAGGNLFHSFNRFRIGSGESATFTAPADSAVANVIARVTGGEASEINGLLRVSMPDANLFFVNPAGITVGPEGRLDVSGSVVLSTANLVRFSDGMSFPANATSVPPVLSTAAPSAFGFLGPMPGRFVFDGGGVTTGGLAAATGKTISIVAGSVRLERGRVLAIGGRVNVVSVGSAGEIEMDAGGVIDVSASPQLGAVELLDGASLRGPAGGGVVVRGASLRVEQSGINADSDETPGGGIDVDVRGDIDLLNARLSSDNFGDAPGGSISLRAGGDITIRGLSPDGVAPVSTNTTFNGRGGDVVLDAGGSVSISNEAAVTAFVLDGAAGGGGDIQVAAGGEVAIDGAASTSLTGLATETFQDTSGAAGDVTIQAPVVRLTERAEVTSTTRGAGDAGVLRIMAGQLLIDGRNAVSLNPAELGRPVITGLQSRVGRIGGAGATGAGGTIIVDADVLRITDGGVLSATTFGRGTGGDVEVNAKSIDISGSDPTRFTGIFARTQLPQNGGVGGDVNIRTDTLALAGHAEISAASTGSGTGGTLTVAARRAVAVRDGGRLSVSAGFFDLRDLLEGEMPTPDIEADAGAMTITAPRIELLDDGAILARATGNSGIVRLRGDGFTRVSRSSIAAQAGREGGVIDLASDAVVLERSIIRGRAAGQDVAVTISAQGLIQFQSIIETDNLVLPPEVDIAGSLARLPGSLADPNLRLIDACGMRVAESSISSFVFTGRGGTPIEPGGFVPAIELHRGG